MAGASPSDDYSKLMREVEQSLSRRAPAGRGEASPARSSGPAGLSRTRTAVVGGAAAAAVVFLLFVLLPFLGAVSGAAGAFLGAAAATFVLLRRR